MNPRSHLISGVVAMAILILATLGALHLYASSRVHTALDQIIREVSIDQVTQVTQMANPGHWYYRISLRVSNNTRNALQIEVTEVHVSIDECFTGSLAQAKACEGTVESGDYIQFKGDFDLGIEYAALRPKGEVTVETTGTLIASTNYLWVNKTAKQTFTTSIQMAFT